MAASDPTKEDFSECTRVDDINSLYKNRLTCCMYHTQMCSCHGDSYGRLHIYTLTPAVCIKCGENPACHHFATCPYNQTCCNCHPNKEVAKNLISKNLFLGRPICEIRQCSPKNIVMAQPPHPSRHRRGKKSG